MMNKKVLILNLLVSLTVTNLLPSQPSFGVEMTFPLSALLYLLEGGTFHTISSSISNAGVYTQSYTFFVFNPNDLNANLGYPQVDGYFATTSPFDLVLQPGVNQNAGFLAGNTPFGNPIMYFSDVMRAMRNVPVPTGYTYIPNFSLTNTNPCGNVACPSGPSNSNVRGQPTANVNHSLGETFDEAAATFLFIGNNNWTCGAGYMKYYGFTSATGTTIGPSDTNLFTQDNTYYFAQTGVGVYLPLHMVSPGDHLRAADPNYLNFGPAPNPSTWSAPGNTPISGVILPWTYGYMPRNIPAQLLGQPEFTSPGNTNQTIQF